MTQHRHLLLQPLIFTSIAMLCFSGCDKAEPQSYRIPKEERSVETPTVASKTSPPSATTANMQVLPGMASAAEAAGEVGYITPGTWQELPASGIRKANFNITGTSSSAEVTILTFPGDVGGQLANINRWRGQIGLSPATPEDLPEYTEGYEISGHRGLYVRLEGENKSILGALLPFHGNTWFFKMLGDTPIVLENETAMQQFLDSIEMPAHAH